MYSAPYTVKNYTRFSGSEELIKQHHWVYKNPTVHVHIKLGKHDQYKEVPFRIADVFKTALHYINYELQKEFAHCGVGSFRFDLVSNREQDPPAIDGLAYGGFIEYNEEAIKKAVEELEKTENTFQQILQGKDEQGKPLPGGGKQEITVVATMMMLGCECSSCASKVEEILRLQKEQKEGAMEHSIGGIETKEEDDLMKSLNDVDMDMLPC